MTSAADARPYAAIPAATVALAGKVAEWIVLALLLTIVPRSLGPGSYGALAAALSLVTLGSAAFALGGPTLVSRFVPRADPTERAALARALAIRSLRWRALGGAAVSIGVLVLVIAAPDRVPAGAALLVLAAVLADAGATLAFTVALGLGRTGLWAMRYPLQTAAVVALAPPLDALLGRYGALLAVLAAALLALAVGLVAAGRDLRGAPRVAVPPEAARFAALQGSAGLLTQVVHRGGVVAAALLAGTTQAGYAAVAIGVGLALTYAVWQVFAAELPVLAAHADPAGVAGHVRRRAGVMLALAAPVGLAAVAAGGVLPAIAGESFRGAVDALPPALALVALAPVAAAGAQLSALALQPGVRLAAAVAGVTAFALALPLVPELGAEGAAWATFAGVGATAAWLGARYRRQLGARLLVTSCLAAAVVLAVGAAL
jgi:O-antigen/teichoic acid export membrane protein